MDADRPDPVGGAPTSSRYVVEVALRGEYSDVRRLSARARTAAAASSSTGAAVRFIRTIYVPEEGACLLLFQATTAEAARAAAAEAGFSVGKVTRALSTRDP